MSFYSVVAWLHLKRCCVCGAPGKAYDDMVFCDRCAEICARIIAAVEGQNPAKRIFKDRPTTGKRVCAQCGNETALLPQGICRNCLDVITGYSGCRP